MKIMIGWFQVRLEAQAIEVASLHQDIGLWARLEWPVKDGEQFKLTIKSDDKEIKIRI